MKLLFCKLGFHKWRKGFGWSKKTYPNDIGIRFDFCLCCDKNRWVDDDEGYKKMIKESEYWSSPAGKREKRLSKLLDGK